MSIFYTCVLSSAVQEDGRCVFQSEASARAGKTRESGYTFGNRAGDSTDRKRKKTVQEAAKGDKSAVAIARKVAKDAMETIEHEDTEIEATAMENSAASSRRTDQPESKMAIWGSVPAAVRFRRTPGGREISREHCLYCNAMCKLPACLFVLYFPLERRISYPAMGILLYNS